jgi:CPA2 family monovalent cation:H+ antiporter-2
VRSDLFILARTRYVTEVDVLHSLGASRVIPEEFETSIEIFSHLLKELHIPNNVVEAQIAMVRAGRYGMLRGIGASASRNQELMDFFAATATQTYLLSAESPACGKTMRELDLRARTGVTLIALVRDGKPIANPNADTRLEGHDVLVLLGSHQQLDQAKTIFEGPGK